MTGFKPEDVQEPSDLDKLRATAQRLRERAGAAPLTPFEAARQAFDAYCAMDTGALPTDPGSALQVRMWRWTQSRVAKHELPPGVEGALGMSEELGELSEALLGLLAAAGRLSHLMLNVSQGRRGLEHGTEELRQKVADALADHSVFAHMAATAARLDYWTLVERTAEEVMKRNWKEHPKDAHQQMELFEGGVWYRCAQCNERLRPEDVHNHQVQTGHSLATRE